METKFDEICTAMSTSTSVLNMKEAELEIFLSGEVESSKFSFHRHLNRLNQK